MKKKGLIISTIVMVVVLIASLTTATYAWFNSEAQAKVTDITISVGTSSNVLIGVKKAGFTDSSYGTAAANFKNGNVTYTSTTAGKLDGNFNTGGTNGLGMNINLNANLSSAGGVYTAETIDTSASFVANSYNSTNFFCTSTYISDESTTAKIKAAASIDSKSANGNKGGDVIFAPFGVRAAQNQLKYMWCDITFESSDEYWGIVTAIEFDIQIDGKHYIGAPFQAVSTAINWSTATGYDANNSESQKGKHTFRIMLDDLSAGDSYLPTGDAAKIYKCSILAFINGFNPNCIADATPFGNVKMTISFDASKTAPASDALTTVLTLVSNT